MLRARPRPRWADLPNDLRQGVEALLGAAVSGAESRAGGWSPGSADRLVLGDGRRIFVKAATTAVNAVTVDLHRREAEVLALLGGAGTAPELLGVVDLPPWFALVIDDVDGRHPDPADPHDIVAVLDAVAALPGASAGARDLLPSITDDLADAALGWHRLLEDDALEQVPAAARGAVPALAVLASQVRVAAAGDSIVHGDLRMDNVLIDGTGRARLVDWPAAAVGARLFDGVTLLLDARRTAGVQSVTAGLAHPLFAAIAPADIDVLLAVLGAYFFDSARRPPAPGVEAIRGFQLEQGLVALDWLLERRPGLLG